MSEPETGRVIFHDGPRFWVEVNGMDVPCTLRGRLKKDWLRVTSLVVAGDEVLVNLNGDGTGVISGVLPRRTELGRVGFAGYFHAMAANVDVMVIVLAAQQPRFRRTTAERLMVVARQGRMQPVLVVNKCDLVDPAAIAAQVEPVRDGGVTVILCSAESGAGVAELRAAIAGKTAVLAGPSGVGKSTLINALYPQWRLRTGAISSYSNKGKHTTTSSRLYRLPDGGYLVDTPGIKDIGLGDVGGDEVTETFPEIAEQAAACKFSDCSHTHEPGCAVKRAVAIGQIEAGRLRSYLRLQSRS